MTNYREILRLSALGLSQQSIAQSCNTIHWHAFDQVLVRGVLADSIKTINYCKVTGKHRLITRNGIPDKNISDHLPLFVEVSI